jgi:hypothetical protein
VEALSYDASPFKVREDLAAAHRRAWKRLAGPGTWLDGVSRINVAEEVRHARGCALCARRKAALSTYAIDGAHDSLGRLPENWVEAIHRIVTDPGRLTHSWYKKLVDGNLAETEYVEIVSIIAHVTAVDTFARGLGIPQEVLPAPRDGRPSQYRPAEARRHQAWVPVIDWDEHGPNEADYFVGPGSNIRQALTLVPDEARSFFDVAANQYLSGRAMRDFSREYRTITHAQIELLAARVSALNQCLY